MHRPSNAKQMGTTCGNPILVDVAICATRALCMNRRADSDFNYDTSCKVLIVSKRDNDQLTLPVFFTLQKANASLPDVEETVRRIIAIKEVTENAAENEVTDSIMKLEQQMQRLEDLGCVLKDLSQGLVDFPAVRLGSRVWLCWKLGEKSVAFWHGLSDGFSGRQRAKEDDFYEDDVAIKSLATESLPKC